MVMLPMTLAEPYPPKTTSIFTFCIALCIFVTGDRKDYKFDVIKCRSNNEGFLILEVTDSHESGNTLKWCKALTLLLRPVIGSSQLNSAISDDPEWPCSVLYSCVVLEHCHWGGLGGRRCPKGRGLRPEWPKREVEFLGGADSPSPPATSPPSSSLVSATDLVCAVQYLNLQLIIVRCRVDQIHQRSLCALDLDFSLSSRWQKLLTS